MKKFFNFFAFIAVAATAITACNKEVEVSSPIEEQEFVYTFAIGQDDALTKAVLASDANGKFAQWESGDKLGSITTNSSGFSSIIPADGDNPATFSIYSKGGLSEGNTITVWYPYGGSTQSEATAVSLVIPDEQHHLSDGSFDFDAMPMVAKQITVTDAMTSSSNTTPLATINLANMGSVLNFKVFSTSATYAGEKVKKITFNAKNEAGSADANIGGTFEKNLATIDPDTESTMTISNFTTGVTSIVTSPYADAAIGTSKADALDLFMVVAPGTYKGTIVVLTDAAEYTYTLSDAKTFVRSGIKAFGLDLNSTNVSREEKIVVDYVTLPWAYPEGDDSATRDDIQAITGVTAVGLGTDYAVSGNAPYLIKLDGTGDYFQIKTDGAIGQVSVKYKMIGGANTSYLNIFESADGSDWGERLDRLTISGTQNSVGTLTTTAVFNDASRFVKIVFEKGSNVGIGGISIYKPSTDPVIQASDIANVPAAGVVNENWTYIVKNFVDDVEVAEVTGCVSDAIADAGSIVYSVAPNYTTTGKNGTIVLWSAADHSITTTINVAQLKSTLTVSELTVTIPASSSTATFTVTSAEFSYNAVVASTETGMNLSISSGATGSASASPQTVTVSSTTEAPTSGDPITLGTINVYRNGNASDSQLKSITIKKAVNSGSGSGPAAGTVLWTDTFGDSWGGTSTTFAQNALLSTYDYAGRTGYSDNTDVTLTADSNNVRGTKSSGNNCSDSHLWFNKSTNGSVTTSAIRLYGATSLVLTYDQGTSGSSLTAGYSTDGGTSWTDFEASGPQANVERAFTVDSGTTSIILRFVHVSTNAKNTRFDNPKLAVGN